MNKKLTLKEAQQIVARNMGNALVKKRGKKWMSRLGRKGAAKRWENKVKAENSKSKNNNHAKKSIKPTTTAK